MKKQEQLKIVSISYLVSILLSLLINYLKNLNFEYYGCISAIKISTILSFWWLFYFNIGWKIPLINKILYKQNLNGTWYGTYKSNIANCNKINEGAIVLRIKQNFLNISVTSYTEKYKNYSYSEELKYDEKSDTSELIYVYSQKENNDFDFAQRNGTADLKFSKSKNKHNLSGEFWTISNTKGKLKLVKVSNIIVNSFEEGEELHNNCK